MSQQIRVRAVISAVALVLGLGTVAACGSDGDAAKDTTGVTSKDGKTEVTTPEGTATAGQSLPASFPTDDIPLLDEKVVSAVEGGASGKFAWSVVMQTSRAVEDVTKEVKKDFADAGYAGGRGGEMGDVSVLHFTNARYDVGVTAARTSGNVTITYVVKKAG